MQRYTQYISSHFREWVLAPADHFAELVRDGVHLHLINSIPLSALSRFYYPERILSSVTRTGYARQIRWCLKAGFAPTMEQLLIAVENGHMGAFKILCGESGKMVASGEVSYRSIGIVLSRIIRSGNTDMYRRFYTIPNFSRDFISDDQKSALSHTTNPYMIDCVNVHYEMEYFVESMVKHARAEVFARFLKIAKIDWSEYPILPEVVENPDLETVRMVLEIIAKPPVHYGTTKLETYISTYLGKLRRGPENDAALIEILREYNVYDHDSYMIMYLDTAPDEDG